MMEHLVIVRRLIVSLGMIHMRLDLYIQSIQLHPLGYFLLFSEKEIRKIWNHKYR